MSRQGTAVVAAYADYDDPVRLRELDAAVAAAPQDVALRRERAELLASLLRYAEAEQELRAAARLDARDVATLTALGALLCRGGRWRDAMEPLRSAVELAPDQGLAHYYLGDVYSHVELLPAALASYETAATLLPDPSRALKGAGHVLDRMGRPAEAAAAHRRGREAQRARAAGAGRGA